MQYGFCDEVRVLLQRWIDTEGLALFSALCRKDLRQLLRSDEAVRFIEARCTIGNYADLNDHARHQYAVGRRLKRDGIQRPRGKRAPPHLVALVEDVAPILVAYGVRSASGDNARMVLILRRIAGELWKEEVDPRGEMRRVLRREKKQRELAESLAIEAFVRGLRGDIA